MLTSPATEFGQKSNTQPLSRHNVNVLLFSEEGNIYIFERFCKKSLAASGQSDPYHPSVEKWHDIPGGKVDRPDTNIETLIHENTDELGIRVHSVVEWSVMPNPTPNCEPGSTRTIYIVTNYAGTPQNKAGIEEGHLGLKAVKPKEAIELLGRRIDAQTCNFLNGMAEDYFVKFCARNQTQSVPDAANQTHMIHAPG